MVLSLAFILAFVGAGVALLIGIIIFSQVQDDMLQTFGDPLLITETNSTEFTSTTPISHAYDEVTTTTTHTGDTLFTTIPNLSLSSGNFTAGDQYLVMFHGDVEGDDFANAGNSFNGANYNIKSRHGSTDFAGSEMSFSHRAGAGTFQYHYFTIWTAVSGEDLTMQFKNEFSAREFEADQLSITAISLEDFIENEDWFFDVRTTQDTLQCIVFSASACDPTGDWTQTNPSITFTTNGSDDWLVMASSNIHPQSRSNEMQTRINFDNTLFTPEHRVAGDDSEKDRQVHFLARVYTPSATSHTFETEASQDIAQNVTPPTAFPNLGTRDYSHIFAINLDKFEYHADNYIATVTVTSTSGYGTQSNSMMVDPPNTIDTFIMSYAIHDNLSPSNSDPRNRMQVDNTDEPPTQTTDAHIYKALENGNSGADRHFYSQLTMENLAGMVMVDVDVDSTNAFVPQHELVDNQLVAFTMSAKTFEFQSQVPDSFNQASNIAFTVIGIVPVALFFFLFAIFGGRTGE